MSDLRDLYQEVILDHNRRPRNFRELPDATGKVEGRNPLCGDQLTVYLRVKDDVVEDATFQGSGCAISKASASLMTDSIKGKTVAEVESLFEAVHRMVTAKEGQPMDQATLGKLSVLSGVAAFPVRVKCAILAWHALHAALQGQGSTVSTEDENVIGNI